MSERVSAQTSSNNFVERFFSSVHSAGLNIFRIGFGVIMIWEAWRFIAADKVFGHWILPSYLYKYPLFGWVQPWPDNWLYIHVIAIGVLGLFITLGLFYRVSMTLMFFGFTYIFLLDAARYLNHFYLICILSFLMMFMPLNRGWSLDALWFNKSLRPPTMPRWVLWLLRAQVGIPYFYGGIAKINKDWLRGEPMHTWLLARADYPVIGLFADKLWFAYLFSYGGLLLDLLAVPFLLWKPTRLLTFLVLVLFHFTNGWIFNIGVFPWMMLVATTIFFKPDWPLKLFNDLRKPNMRLAYAITAIIFAIAGGYASKAWQLVPILTSAFAGLVCLWLYRDQFMHKQANSGWKPIELEVNNSNTRPKWAALTIALFSIWILAQSLIPLRHHLYPTWVHWTDQGNYFAWRMKLRDRAGNVRFWVTDQRGQSIELTALDIGLTDFQSLKILSRADLIHQTAYFIQDKFEAEGYGDVQVYARNIVSLNGREPAPLVDPYVDLTTVPMGVGKFAPVLELPHPLRRPNTNNATVSNPGSSSDTNPENQSSELQRSNTTEN